MGNAGNIKGYQSLIKFNFSKEEGNRLCKKNLRD
jgi:hypothetical protein